MTDQTKSALRELIERLAAFTSVVADAHPDNEAIISVSNDVIERADDATDALAVEPTCNP